MANVDVDPNLGLIDKRKTPTQTADNLTNEQNYTNISALRTRLAAINGAYYTATRLDQLSKNDMVYALRMSDDTAGVG